MARPLRVEYPGAYYHVISRGNGGESIFLSVRDREKFLEYLEKASERFSIIIHTYCLMTNHYHILIETPQANLSLAIQWLNVSYAAYFNRKRGRSGHLFQGRFKAILIDADEYLKVLSRYIHLNPVRAKMVANPLDYKWSSYPVYVGEKEAPDWLETEWLLANFGKRKKQAAKRYQGFVEEIDIRTLENPNKDIVGGFMLGDMSFVDWVKETFLSDRDDEKEIPQLRTLRPRVSLERIVEGVCRELGCTEQRIRQKGRHRNTARELTICLARELSGLTCKDLGKFFGGVSGAAITQSCNHVVGEMLRNKKLQGKAKKIKKEILNF